MTDPREENAKVHELSGLRARKEEAEELLDDKGVFMGAVRAVRIRWFGQLMDTGNPALIAKLQALDAIPEALQLEVNAYKVALRQGHARGT